MEEGENGLSSVNNQCTAFSVLPIELKLKIFSYLTVQQLAVASLTSHEWYILANDPLLWKLKYCSLARPRLRLSREKEKLGPFRRNHSSHSPALSLKTTQKDELTPLPQQQRNLRKNRRLSDTPAPVSIPCITIEDFSETDTAMEATHQSSMLRFASKKPSQGSISQSDPGQGRVYSSAKGLRSNRSKFVCRYGCCKWKLRYIEEIQAERRRRVSFFLAKYPILSVRQITQLLTVFRLYAYDEDKVLSATQLKRCLNLLCPSVTDGEMQLLYHRCNNNCVDETLFIEFMAEMVFQDRLSRLFIDDKQPTRRAQAKTF